MKTFILLFVILTAHEAFGQVTFGQEVQQKQQEQQNKNNTEQQGQQQKITKKPKAVSDFQNCNCQCDSYTWTDGTTTKGNCKSQDNNGALFCYVSGRARTACGDVQTSTTVRDNLGNLRTYSYEACTTPPRNQCGQQGLISSLISNNQFGNNQFGNNQFANQNFGDGDLEKIQQGAAGLGGIIGNNQIGHNQFGNNQFGNNQLANQNFGDGDLQTIQQGAAGLGGIIDTGVNPNVFGINQGVVNPSFGQGIIGSGILTGSRSGGIQAKTGSGSKGSSDSVLTSGIKFGAA